MSERMASHPGRPLRRPLFHHGEEIDMSILHHVLDHESAGSARCDDALGFVQMPDGYALMLNPDRTHFYWLREDGVESCIHWDKWATYRGAKHDKLQAEAA